MNVRPDRKGVAEEKYALILQEEIATTQAEKDIIHLKMMVLDIAPLLALGVRWQPEARHQGAGKEGKRL